MTSLDNLNTMQRFCHPAAVTQTNTATITTTTTASTLKKNEE